MRFVSRDVYGKPQPGPDPGISRRALFRLRLTGAARRDVDFAGLTAAVRAGWDRQGHEPWLRAIEPVAELVAEVVGANPGVFVLDAGAGDGNLALACARRGATVSACDIAPWMVERGRERCEADGAEVDLREADVADLPYIDGEFDSVASSFGAALSPKPKTTVRELVRVTRPGGLVALTAWTPRGLPGGFDALVEQVEPLPDGVRLPSDWGSQATAKRRLGSLLADLKLLTRTVMLRFPSPDALFEALTLPRSLSEAQLAELRPRFDALLATCNNRPPEVEIDARYLLAVGRRPVPEA
jgi:SAM-dependent methyltransferase